MKDSDARIKNQRALRLKDEQSILVQLEQRKKKLGEKHAALDEFKRKLLREIEVKKESLKNEQDDLRKSLEDELLALKNEHEGIITALRKDYGQHYEAFIGDVYGMLKSGKFRALYTEEGISGSTYTLSKGSKGDHIAKSITQISYLTLQIESQVNLNVIRRNKWNTLMNEIVHQGGFLENERDAIAKLEIDLTRRQVQYQNELKERRQKLDKKVIDVESKLSKQETLLLKLYELRLEAAKQEMLLLTVLFMHRGYYRHHAQRYSDLLNLLSRQASYFKERIDLELLKEASLVNFIRNIETKKTDAITNLAWEDYTGQEILDQVEVTGDEKLQLIINWYHALAKEAVFVRDLETAQDMGLSEISNKGFEEFQEKLFQLSLQDNTFLVKVKFADDRWGYQVTLNQKTYWIGSCGDLQEFDASALHGLFSYEFQTSETSEVGKQMRNIYQEIKDKFAQQFQELEAQQQGAIGLAVLLLQEADKTSDEVGKGKLVEFAREVVDIAIGLTPAGVAVSLYEAVFGVNIYGEKLDTSAQVISFVSVLAGNRTVVKYLSGRFSNVLSKFLAETKVVFDKMRFKASKKAASRLLRSADEVITRLTPEKLKKYLENVDKVPRETLTKDMETIGLRLKGKGSRDGRFMEFVDSQGNVRAKIHPPDLTTPTHHLHIYDRNGRSLNKALKVVSSQSRDAHIPVQGN
jgi:hypothetical protein